MAFDVSEEFLSVFPLGFTVTLTRLAYVAMAFEVPFGGILKVNVVRIKGGVTLAEEKPAGSRREVLRYGTQSCR